METSSYIALSLQTSLQTQMNTVANNLANMNTVGFKAQRTMFTEYLARPDGPKPEMRRPYSFVLDYASYRDARQALVTFTDNPLDFALEGDGYFTVQADDGSLYYTRAGRFSLSPDGVLIDRNGAAVLDEAGAPIQVPEGADRLLVGPDGTLSADGQAIGRFGIAVFGREQFLEEVAGGLYRTAEAPDTAAPRPNVIQKVVEESNVQPILEMTQMIDLQRRYSQAQQFVTGEHDRLRTAIGRLGRVA